MYVSEPLLGYWLQKILKKQFLMGNTSSWRCLDAEYLFFSLAKNEESRKIIILVPIDNWSHFQHPDVESILQLT